MIRDIVSLDLSRRRISISKMTINDYKDENNVNIIQSTMIIDNGYVTSKEIPI